MENLNKTPDIEEPEPEVPDDPVPPLPPDSEPPAPVREPINPPGIGDPPPETPRRLV